MGKTSDGYKQETYRNSDITFELVTAVADAEEHTNSRTPRLGVNQADLHPNVDRILVGNGNSGVFSKNLISISYRN